MESVGKVTRKQAKGFLKEAVLLLPRMIQLLYRLMRDPRVGREDKILAGAVLAYIVSPIDLVPDFVPLFGQMDDLLAVSLVLSRLIANAGEEVVREHWSGSEQLVPTIHKISTYSKILLPDRVVGALFDKFGS